MPQGRMNAAKLQKEMAQGADKAYNRDQVAGLMKGIDRVTYLQRKNQDIPQPRPNKDFINSRGANDVMPFTGKVMRDARIEETGEDVARKVSASRSAARNASGRTPIQKPTTIAKPVSAKTGAKMVAAMAGKESASPMRKLLKIK